MRDGGYGNRDAVLGAQAAVASGLLRSLAVTRPCLDAIPVRGPAQCRRECRDTTGQSRTDADHYRTYRRGVYRHAIAVLLWLVP